MKSRDFCYWLQGYFEVNDAAQKDRAGLTADQADAIKAHLAMVFVHEIDPSFPASQKQQLDQAHKPNDQGGAVQWNPNPVFRC